MAEPLEEALSVVHNQENRELLRVVMSLPVKYRQVIYLYYYEGYSAAETGALLGKKVNTIYTLLDRGRRMLKKELGGENADGY